MLTVSLSEQRVDNLNGLYDFFVQTVRQKL